MIKKVYNLLYWMNMIRGNRKNKIRHLFKNPTAAFNWENYVIKNK